MQQLIMVTFSEEQNEKASVWHWKTVCQEMNVQGMFTQQCDETMQKLKNQMQDDGDLINFANPENTERKFTIRVSVRGFKV